MRRGAREIWKVYVNGSEDPTLRVTAEWGLEESGSGAKAPYHQGLQEAAKHQFFNQRSQQTGPYDNEKPHHRIG